MPEHGVPNEHAVVADSSHLVILAYGQEINSIVGKYYDIHVRLFSGILPAFTLAR